MCKTETHESEVKNAIERAISTGINTFSEILNETSGADPRLVHTLFQQVTCSPDHNNTPSPASSKARRRTAELLSLLPAPDPMWSQWWFSLDSIESLAKFTWSLSCGGSVAFLGAPTVGYYFSESYDLPTTILDVDLDVVKCIAKHGSAKAVHYDSSGAVPRDLIGKHNAVVLDPPWYPESTWQFICRAREMLSDTGFILCIIPSRLTRPGLIAERSELLNRLLKCGVEIVSLESERVQYRVPFFEEKAYSDLKDFSTREWRSGDLLVMRINSDVNVKLDSPLPPNDRLVFSRVSTEKRVFLCQSRIKSSMKSWFEQVDQFNNEVSTRKISVDEVALWTTDKNGARVKNFEIAKLLLEEWVLRRPDEEIVKNIIDFGLTSTQAQEALRQFRTIIKEDSNPERCFRRTTFEMEDFRKKCQSPIAAQPTKRNHEYHNDQFRLGFQRDRDRVLWSPALRRLGNKTQVFAIENEGELRGRLGHSIEVMQLASTIAASFGLDRDLTEAGALVHDIGHCPFGHAGEHALNKTLNEIDSRFGGFNHYEHGLDVVCWLESIYRSPGSGEIPGLNLTVETVECIIKHAFYRDKNQLSQVDLLKNSKHQDLDNRSCHLEGQAVRIADKISYLISDMEDGIRMGVISLDALRTCRLFDRPPIDLTPDRDEELYERFVSQRRAILKVLMEDVLTSSDQRMHDIKNVNDVRDHYDYIITYSKQIEREVSEVWEKLQEGQLHKNDRVVAANLRAARIIGDLLILYTIAPELVDSRFKKSHEGLSASMYIKWYHDKLGEEVGIASSRLTRYFYDHVIGRNLKRQGDNYLVPTKNLVLAKDYVASAASSFDFGVAMVAILRKLRDLANIDTPNLNLDGALV